MIVLSKAYFDIEKSQMFTDQLKLISKFFVLQLGKSGISFSKKIPKSFDRKKIARSIESILQFHKDIFVLCRSTVCQIDLKAIEENLKLMLEKKNEILNTLKTENEFNDGTAKRMVAKRFEWSRYSVKEESGIFERRGLWDLLEQLTRKKKYFLVRAHT